VVQSATESVYHLVRVRRGVAKVGHKWGKLWAVLLRMKIVGSAPNEKSFYGVAEQARRVYYGVVFEVKKEIPVETAGTILSESFDLNGTSGGGQTPEPSNFLPFGSGILGLAGVLRRKLL
jgi:hypothetical protein